MSATSTKLHGLALLTVLAALLAGAAPDADAAPPPPADLQVWGGQDTWHPDTRFGLGWSVPPSQVPAIVTAHYRIRDPLGTTIQEGQSFRLDEGIGGLEVPPIPGVYLAELWFEDAAGVAGPTATAKLRFDDARPAAAVPQPVPTWIGRTAFPLRLRIDHPPGPAPLSGIRGYAILIGSLAGEVPCATADRCTESETTLQGGAGEDEIEVRSLPEGTSYLHAVAVSGSGMKSASVGRTVLRVDTTDPVTRLEGAPAGWTDRTVSLTARAADAGSGMEPGVGPLPFTAIRVDGGTPAIEPGPTVAASVIDEGVHRIAYYARDVAGNADDGGGANGIPNRPPRTAWVRIDRTPPTIAFPNTQDPRDPDLVRARISDALSGANPARGWIGVRRAGSGDRFVLLPADPAGDDELRVHWSSDSYPPGEYEFEAVGYDAAGNASATRRRQNGGPMILSNPLKTTTRLDVSFHSRDQEQAVPYGQGTVVDGNLVAGTRSALAGVPVRVVERFAAGSQPAIRTSIARTDANGDVSVRTAPGPSRTVAMEFEGSPVLSRSIGRTLALAVRSGVRLRASSSAARVGGRPVVFSGRLLAQPGAVSPRGRSVQLQFRLPGLPWSEFRTVRTDRWGRFRYAYRFSDDDSRGVRFQFRAYVPAQEDWPYEPGGSRPVLVRGI